MTNLLGFARGRYSIRARGGYEDDALGKFSSRSTRSRNLRVAPWGIRSDALLRTIMAEIDVAVFTVDAVCDCQSR
jgi:hypothetical protein